MRGVEKMDWKGLVVFRASDLDDATSWNLFVQSGELSWSMTLVGRKAGGCVEAVVRLVEGKLVSKPKGKK